MEENFNYMANEDIIHEIVGTKDIDVMDSECVDNSLSRLARMDVGELTQIKGMTKRRAKQLMLAFELGKRLFTEKHTYNDLGSSIALYHYLKPKMEFRNTECAYLVIMNQNFKEIKTIKISEGGVTETSVDVREIMRHVVVNRGTIIAIAHNHPCGNPSPSKNDDLLTIQISKACDIMRIFFMDHIIIADNAYYSYHDKGRV